ncbi:prolyl-tRNA synthetase [Psychromicrobium lacuslunae]|uniref:Prolyl-tRNA synthetase n=1 Tax=Psychromicrobium lacuslunae TaxID=1618207 RepID=A0A0D4C376_9MICC|nr:prolyl-tRNA synthetase [Psychromicrobium lacuslunae]
MQNVRGALRALGVEDTVITLEQEVPTAEAAAQALGCTREAIANSLIFELDDEPLLILASGAARVDTKLIAELLGSAKIRRASPEFVLEKTGQRVGGVAPLGHPQPIRTILDKSLAAHPVLWAGAGDHLSMFSTSYQQLLQITGAIELQVR